MISSNKIKIIRVATVPIYMNIVLKGQLSFLNRFYNIIAITGNDNLHFNTLKEREQVTVRAVEIERNIRPKEDVLALCRLIRMFRKEKPTVVHSHTPKAGLLSMMAAYFSRVPIRIHTVTGMPLMELSGPKYYLVLIFEKLTYKLATHIYPNSKGLNDYILAKNMTTRNKSTVLLNGSTNGVDTTWFDPLLLPSKLELRLNYGIGVTAYVFLFVGRIAREKGIVEMITSFVDFQKTNRDSELVLIGVFEKVNGLLNKEIISVIESHPQIKLLGRFDDVRPFYKLADCFVLPSYREGFPNAVMEAGAMALPCIVTDINGCNEIIENGVNGWVIEPKSIGAIREAFCFMIRSNVGLMSSEKIRERIIRNYERKEVQLAIKKEYDRLISEL